MSDRTFKVETPAMSGKDVKAWQSDIKQVFAKMSIDCPIKLDGIYGVSTRSFTAALVVSSGLSPRERMKNGVAPELRSVLRNQTLTPKQKEVKNSTARKEYRARLRKQWSPTQVHTPVTKILQDSWGYHPGIHDGLDLITEPDPVIFAMVKCQIIDVRSSGWWGLGAPTDPNLKAKGDGIVQMKVLENVGPFKRGMHIGYGHAEKALVKVGQVVKAGTPVAHAGLANAWHIHLMVNDGTTDKGVGTTDPRPFVDYAVKHG